MASAENKYRVAASREQSIEASLERIKGGVNITNQAEITLRELEREAQANKVLYESFLAKFKETSEERTLKTSTARIIEQAKVPGAPSAPQKSRIALIWLAAGLALGAGLAFLLEQLDRGFHSAKQVEEMLGVPVMASVPKADGEVEEPSHTAPQPAGSPRTLRADLDCAPRGCHVSSGRSARCSAISPR